MSNNPLAGISVPSAKAIADEVMSHFGTAVLDLSKPLARERLRKHIEFCLSRTIDMNLERAMTLATEKAIRHVFSLMRNPNYQEDRAKRQKANRQRQMERQADDDKKLQAERAERQKKKMQVVEKVRPVIQ